MTSQLQEKKTSSEIRADVVGVEREEQAIPSNQKMKKKEEDKFVCFFAWLVLTNKVELTQTLLFVSGINTFLRVLFGTRLPAVIGGSSAYIVLILCIIRYSSVQRITEPHELDLCTCILYLHIFLHSMMETQGVLIVAANLLILYSFKSSLN
ncbi:hypothetical protein MKX03_027061 [Papaver bracteatum]|nr:hypothetical protein MKX03_027061 [Papaver bracteatum]